MLVPFSVRGILRCRFFNNTTKKFSVSFMDLDFEYDTLEHGDSRSNGIS